MEWIWGKNQTLGRSTLGDAKTIKNVTREKLLGYMRSLYHPTNMVIAIVGNFLLENAERLLRKNFETQSKGKIPNFKRVNLVHKKNVIKAINSDTQQNQLILGFVTGVFYHHKDRFPLLVAANILGGGGISRIFRKLVYKLGIAYAVRTYVWVFKDTGLFLVSGGFSKEIEKAIKTILEELTRLKSEKVSSEELQAIKEISKSNFYFYMETSDAIAAQYATEYITENRILTPDETAQEIEKVTGEEIQRVAKKYFTKQNLRLMVRGPSVKKLTKSFEKLLDDFS
jgi:predicted Zn-dependent peptidase